MAKEIPGGYTHTDIWEREELLRRTKEFMAMRDALAPLYHDVANTNLATPWQLMSYADAEGFALRLRWAPVELPHPKDIQAETPAHSYLEVNAAHGTNLLQFLRRKTNGSMFIQQLSQDAILPNKERIKKVLISDIGTPYQSWDSTPSGWVSTHPMGLWLPEDAYKTMRMDRPKNPHGVVDA